MGYLLDAGSPWPALWVGSIADAAYKMLWQPASSEFPPWTELTPKKPNLLMTVVTPRQAVVIDALIHGATVTEATKKANVSRSTYYIWMKSADFVAELNRLKQEQHDAIRAQLRGLAETALMTLRKVLTGKDVPAMVRLKAALAILQSMGTLDREPAGESDPRAVECNLMEEFLILANEMQRYEIDKD